MFTLVVDIRKWFWYTLDCMQGKVLSGNFRQYGHTVSMVRVGVRVSAKIRVRFRFICFGDPTCSHSLAVMLVVGHTTKQMKHGCSCNIEICCRSVEMSPLGLRPRVDVSTSGQHWMFHLQLCIICILSTAMFVPNWLRSPTHTVACQSRDCWQSGHKPWYHLHTTWPLHLRGLVFQPIRLWISETLMVCGGFTTKRNWFQFCFIIFIISKHQCYFLSFFFLSLSVLVIDNFVSTCPMVCINLPQTGACASMG